MAIGRVITAAASASASMILLDIVILLAFEAEIGF
jgi:hypothetical protein